jgi:hypothetical protein
MPPSSAMVPPWFRHGSAMVPPWFRHGSAMVPPWFRRWFVAMRGIRDVAADQDAITALSLNHISNVLGVILSARHAVMTSAPSLRNAIATARPMPQSPREKSGFCQQAWPKPHSSARRDPALMRRVGLVSAAAGLGRAT